jgi:hypothetical protein
LRNKNRKCKSSSHFSLFHFILHSSFFVFSSCSFRYDILGGFDHFHGVSAADRSVRDSRDTRDLALVAALERESAVRAAELRRREKETDAKVTEQLNEMHENRNRGGVNEEEDTAKLPPSHKAQGDKNDE